MCESLTVDGVTIVCNGGGFPILSQDCHRTTVINCPKLQTSGPIGLDLRGGSNGRVANNTLIYTGGNPGSALGIRVYWRSADYPAQRNQINNNTLINFNGGIEDNNNTDATSYNVLNTTSAPP